MMPAGVIAAAMVLKELEGCRTVRPRPRIRWKVACGLALDESVV